MNIGLKKTALAVGLAIALPVMAAEDNLTPQVLHKFAGAYSIYTPPVYVAKKEVLVGTTGTGGSPFTVDAYGIPGFLSTHESGRAYSLNLTSKEYSDYSMDNKSVPAGIGAASLVATSSGNVVGGVTASSYEDPETAAVMQAGTLFVIDENQTINDYRPVEAFARGAFAARGQLSADDQGNVYFPFTSGGSVNPGSGAINRLMRLDNNGQMNTLVDFTAYSKQWQNATNQANNYWLAKGNAPAASVWSDRDNAIYLLSFTDYSGTKPNCNAALEGYSAPDCSDGTLLQGHLIRISGEALNSEAGVQEADIEILFHFTAGTGGVVNTSASYIPGVVEDGDFLYGISTTVKDENGSGQGIWRIRKSGLAEGETVADTFTTVHRFAPVLTADRRANQLTDDDAGIVGNSLYGPIVLAADGNIYGTTQYDDRTGTNNQGNGTIYRIKVGEAADRSDDVLEQVYSFVDASTGKTPKGLSAGPIKNGKQIIIGATAAGTSTGNGGIFTFEVTPLPGSVTLDASATSAQLGAAVTLSWTSTNAQSCTASASASDVTDWSGVLANAGSQSITAVTGTTTYTVNCEGLDGAALTDQVTITVAAASGSGKGSGGSGSAVGLLVLPFGLLALAGLRRRRTMA